MHSVCLLTNYLTIFALKAWPRIYGIKNFPKEMKISHKRVAMCVCVSECGFAKERKIHKKIKEYRIKRREHRTGNVI